MVTIHPWVALRLIVVGVSPAAGGADTHFYGPFWAHLRPKWPGADAFRPVLWNPYAVEEIATIYWGDTHPRSPSVNSELALNLLKGQALSLSPGTSYDRLNPRGE